MSVSEEGEEDYGFGSEDEPSSDMEMDDSTEYGFDPAEDIDISSRRVSHNACRGVPRGTRSFAASFLGVCSSLGLDVLLCSQLQTPCQIGHDVHDSASSLAEGLESGMVTI